MMWTTSKRKRKEFEAAALEHLDMLYSVALRLTRDEQNAEDLVQDTYVRALRFFDRFEYGTNLRAWLLRIMTNIFVNGYRRRQKEKQLAEQVEQGSAGEVLLSSAAVGQLRDPENQVMTGLLRRELVRALDDLPEDFRVPLVLADVYGFSYREIADIQECPIGTVMSRLHRARKSLQARLMDHALSSGWLSLSGPGKRGTAEAPASLEEYRRRRRSS
jgi:RNA polymerase sigma-70 factor (ECF subfamily)